MTRALSLYSSLEPPLFSWPKITGMLSGPRSTAILERLLRDPDSFLENGEPEEADWEPPQPGLLTSLGRDVRLLLVAQGGPDLAGRHLAERARLRDLIHRAARTRFPWLLRFGPTVELLHSFGGEIVVAQALKRARTPNNR